MDKYTLKYKTLRPVKETPEDYADIEAEITRVLREQIYAPLMKTIPKKNREKFQNAAMDDLVAAIVEGRVHYYREGFVGDFNAATSKKLKEMGAVWDKKKKQWKFPVSLISDELRDAIAASELRFDLTMDQIDKKLASLSPEDVVEKMKLTGKIDKTLWAADRKFKATTESIIVAPDLSVAARLKIAADYTENLKKYIRGWVKEEIPKLREKVQEHVFSGHRYEELAEKINSEYDVGHRKAKFLARQETHLMIAAFKEARYADSGIKEYIWKCVVGSPKHPVRPMHKALNGTPQRFDKPPITDKNGNRNNPGQDFNCRCFAVPIVRFDNL